MSGNKIKGRALALPTFDGTVEKFKTLWPRWETYAELKNFEEAISIDPEDPNLPAKYNVLITNTSIKTIREKLHQRETKWLWQHIH